MADVNLHENVNERGLADLFSSKFAACKVQDTPSAPSTAFVEANKSIVEEL